MMVEQERLQLPSLRQEIFGFLSKFEVVDVTKFFKEKWKIFVRSSITELNRLRLLDQIKLCKKVDYLSLSCEEFKLKDYFLELTLDESRLFFRSR